MVYNYKVASSILHLIDMTDSSEEMLDCLLHSEARHWVRLVIFNLYIILYVNEWKSTVPNSTTIHTAQFLKERYSKASEAMPTKNIVSCPLKELISRSCDNSWGLCHKHDENRVLWLVDANHSWFQSIYGICYQQKAYSLSPVSREKVSEV